LIPDEPEKPLDGLFCSNTTCGAVQPLVDNTDYFWLFGLKKGFKVDVVVLDMAFKGLQKVLHPDKFATLSLSEREASAAASSFVNQAFQTLHEPVERARYLLQLEGVDVLDEGGRSYNNPQLMMEMFALREELDEAESKDDLADIRTRIENDVDASCIALQRFVENNVSLEDQAVRLKYLCKVLEEISIKEEKLGFDDL
jgi:molecular chaperone HscB